VLDRAFCRKIIGKVLVVTTVTQYSRQRCSRRSRAGNSVKSAVQTRVVLLIEPRLHATYTLQRLLVNYKLEAAGESWPNFLRAVIRKWGHCTVNSGKIAALPRRIIDEIKNLFSSVSVGSPFKGTYLFTYLLTYLLSYLLNYLLPYLLSCLITYSFIYLLSHLLNYLLTFLLTYLLNYLLTFLLTHLFIYLLTYLFTYSFIYLLSHLLT